MKKIFAILILFVFCSNFALAETVFYEDFTFYGELVTDIRINKVERHQPIQVAFPSYLPNKIPLILNGEAYYKEINDKPAIVLKLDKLSVGAEKYVPVSVLPTALNGKKLSDAIFVKPNRYFKAIKRINAYSKDVLMFPINRYKYNPTMGKPTANTFIMLLEPVYAVLGAVFYVTSPVFAAFALDTSAPDIKRGTVVEFEFLQEVSRQEIQKALQSEDL